MMVAGPLIVLLIGIRSPTAAITAAITAVPPNNATLGIATRHHGSKLMSSDATGSEALHAAAAGSQRGVSLPGSLRTVCQPAIATTPSTRKIRT